MPACAQGTIKRAVREASGGDAICGGTNAVGATELLPYLRCIMWDRSRQEGQAGISDAQFRCTPPAPFRWADGTTDRGAFRDRFELAETGASSAQHREVGEIDRGRTDIMPDNRGFRDGPQEDIGGDEDEIEDW
eukprot:1186389-Prorocentrum_minimum.AAC.1